MSAQADAHRHSRMDICGDLPPLCAASRSDQASLRLFICFAGARLSAGLASICSASCPLLVPLPSDPHLADHSRSGVE
jgi:hypothetical protein